MEQGGELGDFLDGILFSPDGTGLLAEESNPNHLYEKMEQGYFEIFEIY